MITDLGKMYEGKGEIVFSTDQISHLVATMAQRSVLYEVTASPKPGLVDRFNAGAHKDMDFYTFMDSSTTLYKGFFDCAKLGIAFGIESAQAGRYASMAGMNVFWDESLCLCQLMDAIRKPGLEAEKRMFEMTRGVNTHKGIIFSLGICSAAVGYLEGKRLAKADNTKDSHSKSDGLGLYEMEQICEVVKLMTGHLVHTDFEKLEGKTELTYGEKLYVKYGMLGIRGEVASGFETISKTSFETLRAYKEGTLKNYNQETLTINELLLEVLLRIMCESEDSNVITRGGLEGLAFVKEASRSFIELGGMSQYGATNQLSTLDTTFTARGVSPGGSADLLSVAVFLAMNEGIL